MDFGSQLLLYLYIKLIIAYIQSLVASVGQHSAPRFAKNTFTIQPQTFVCNRNDLQGNQFFPKTHYLSRVVAEIVLYLIFHLTQEPLCFGLLLHRVFCEAGKALRPHCVYVP